MSSRLPAAKAKARLGRLQRRALSLAVAVIRQSGLLPKSFPDGLGDDKKLLGRKVNAQVVVYFADTISGLYQIEPWYQTLRELHRTHRVVIFGTDSRCIKRIRQDSGLPAFTLAHYATVDDLISRSPIRLVLYANHNSGNFFMLRFPNLVHVSIMHGDSDKVVSISNQTKAYDYTFVAGQAAVDRLAKYLPMFDAAQRCIIVGRPQANLSPTRLPVGPESRGGAPAALEAAGATDGAAAAPATGATAPAATPATEAAPDATAPATGPPTPATSRRWRVLYAPTWEGGVPSAAYSSLEAYGPGIVQALCADPRFALTYRPHPLTGVRLPRFAAADHALREAVSQAAAAGRAAGHRVSLGGDVTADLAQADLLISDVSSLAIDFLPTTRPLLVTQPPEPGVVTAATRLLRAVPRLDQSQLEGLAGLVAQQITDDPGRAERLEATTYYLGDVTPGVATKRFVAACGQMIELAENNRAAMAAKLAEEAGPA